MATTQYRVRLTGEERVVEAWAAAPNAIVMPGTLDLLARPRADPAGLRLHQPCM